MAIGEETHWVLLARWVPVFVAIAFNAVMLWPEFSVAVPSLNDDAFHYLYVQRADAAIANGENPFDNWSPTLELGFPEFFYYHHVPHIAVALLYRVLFKQVSLLTLFNLVRYLLLVLLPLTVWWSMRTMGFTPVASAVGAAFAPLISARYLFGFEYDSYIWTGYGMFTQLCATHLLFAAVASLYRVLFRATGYAAAALLCALLVLTDLPFAYMLAVAGGVLFVMSLWRGEAL
jgi:hypothetical protein